MSPDLENIMDLQPTSNRGIVIPNVLVRNPSGNASYGRDREHSSGDIAAEESARTDGRESDCDEQIAVDGNDRMEGCGQRGDVLAADVALAGQDEVIDYSSVDAEPVGGGLAGIGAGWG